MEDGRKFARRSYLPQAAQTIYPRAPTTVLGRLHCKILDLPLEIFIYPPTDSVLLFSVILFHCLLLFNKDTTLFQVILSMSVAKTEYEY